MGILKPMRWRGILLFCAVALMAVGIVIPLVWSPTANAAALTAFGVTGMTLLQASFFLESLFLFWVAISRWRHVSVSQNCLLQIPSWREDTYSSERVIPWLLLGVALMAIGLRLYRLDSPLWLDEIVTVVTSRKPLIDLLTTFPSTNNHLFNTLLVKASIGLFGEREWAARLPAAMFGIGAVLAMYWASRAIASKWASLFTAGLLAVSYHHIFFSQNARGYSAYLFFSLVSTMLFVKGMQSDRGRIWALYVVMIFLNFGSILIGAFVFAAHVAMAAVGLVSVARRGEPAFPLLKRLVGVFAVAGLLMFQLYAAVIPEAVAYINETYQVKSTGFVLFSSEFFLELARGLSAGLNPMIFVLVLPILGIGALGFVVAFQRNWLFLSTLMLPGILMIVYLIWQDATISPRFFILWIIPAIMSGVMGLNASSHYLVAKFRQNRHFSIWLSGSLVILLGVISTSSLSYYYKVPKQDFAGTVEFVEKIKKPGQVIVVMHIAESGVRYYNKKRGVKQSENYYYVRSLPRLNIILALRDAKDYLLVTSFARALRLELPDIYEHIQRHWRIIRTFPGTIGDGDISVWRAICSVAVPAQIDVRRAEQLRSLQRCKIPPVIATVRRR